MMIQKCLRTHDPWGEHDDDLAALVVRADPRDKEQADVAGERKPSAKGCKRALRNKRAVISLDKLVIATRPNEGVRRTKRGR